MLWLWFTGAADCFRIYNFFSIGLVLRSALSVESATLFFFAAADEAQFCGELSAKPSDKQVPVAEPAKDEPCSTSQPSS